MKALLPKVPGALPRPAAQAPRTGVPTPARGLAPPAAQGAPIRISAAAMDYLLQPGIALTGEGLEARLFVPPGDTRLAPGTDLLIGAAEPRYPRAALLDLLGDLPPRLR
jgi:hypothetical protein